MKKSRFVLCLLLALALILSQLPLGAAVARAEDGDAYTVTYMDGDAVFTTEEVESGKTAPSLDGPVKSGYGFFGWYSDKALTARYDFDEQVTGDLTLYALFLPEVTGLKLHTEGAEKKNGGYALKADALTVTFHKDAQPVTLDKLELTVLYSDKDLTTPLTKYPGTNTVAYFSVNMAAGSDEAPVVYWGDGLMTDCVLEAADGTIEFLELQRSPNSGSAMVICKYTCTREFVTVTYDANGGTTGDDWIPSLQAPYGLTVEGEDFVAKAPPEDAVKAPEGMEYSGIEIGGVVFNEGDPISFTYDKDMTFKYLWKNKDTGAVKYTVTYMDGDTVFTTEEVESGKTAPSLDGPEKSGYGFFGWYSDEALTARYDFDEQVTGDLTLYALFLPEVTGLKLHTDGTEDKSGNYALKADTLTVTFHEDAQPVTLDKLELTALYTDQALSALLTTEPVPDTAYYFSVNLAAGSDEAPVVYWGDGLMTDCVLEASDGTIEFVELQRSPNSGSAMVICRYTKQEEPVSYDTQDGSTTWTEETGGIIKITVKRSKADDTCFSHFVRVELDGRKLKMGTDYTAAPGSTVITLNVSLLETLEEGAHTVVVIFDDGQVTAEINIKSTPSSAGDDTSPKTGDRNDLGLWVILMSLSIILIVCMGLHAMAGRKKGAHSR